MNAPDPSHESYAHRIRRHFLADSFARNGLRVVLALFVLAAFAPFLANNHAIVRVAEGHVSFPIFATLEPIEWRFLLYVPIGFIIYFTRHIFSQRTKRNVVFIIGMIALIELALAFSHPVNDPSNDRDRPASFKMMPPIP
jgi:ABC-type microcin C transport system permease subunit YejE